jgi:hypothetical protein
MMRVFNKLVEETSYCREERSFVKDPVVLCSRSKNMQTDDPLEKASSVLAGFSGLWYTAERCLFCQEEESKQRQPAKECIVIAMQLQRSS